MILMLGCILLLFSGSTAEWDLEVGKIMVNYSFSTYCSQSSLVSWTCGYCTQSFDIALIENANNCQGIAGVSLYYKHIVVVFRGTQSLSNWILDLEMETSPYLFGSQTVLLHSGFLSSYLSLAPHIISALKELVLRYPSYPVFLTGHSLGAAQATIMALDLALNYDFDDLNLYTFGSPRVGGRNFSQLFNKHLTGNSWRVVHNRDMIPHLPPQYGAGYFHVATEIFQKANGSVTMCDRSGEDPHCSDQFYVDMSIADHRTYLNMSDAFC